MFEDKGTVKLERVTQFLNMCGLPSVDMEVHIANDRKVFEACMQDVRSIAIGTKRLEDVGPKIQQLERWKAWFGEYDFEFQEIDDIPYQTYYFPFAADHLSEYERARSAERESETNRRRKPNPTNEPLGSYREKSRALCNYYAAEKRGLGPKFDKLLQILAQQKQKAIVYSNFKGGDWRDLQAGGDAEEAGARRGDEGYEERREGAQTLLDLYERCQRRRPPKR